MQARLGVLFICPVYARSFFSCADVAPTGNPPLVERRVAVADWFFSSSFFIA